MPDIIGASLAGCAAALELLRRGRSVTLYEKTPFPRHKVCGEFLDPQAVRLLEGVILNGTPIARVHLVWPNNESRFALPEAALGISRHRLDSQLLRAAVERGAKLIQEAGAPTAQAIVAHGRKPKSQRGRRFFGYKTHFRGGQNDAVELYFNGHAYTGVNPVEDGLTNACGLAREEDLKAVGFDMDRWIAGQPKLAQRLNGLERNMDWLFTGPLYYGHHDESEGYLCGDALNFTDPFTGSGMLCAIATGKQAARSVIGGLTPLQHLEACRGMILPAFRWSSLMRKALAWPITPALLKVLPGSLLYDWSRPNLARL